APSCSILPPLGTSMGFIGFPISGDDTGGLAPGALLDPCEVVCQSDEGFKCGLGVEVVSSIGCLVTFEIEPQRGADRAGSRQPQDNPRAVGKAYPDALIGAGGAVHRIM